MDSLHSKSKRCLKSLRILFDFEFVKLYIICFKERNITFFMNYQKAICQLKSLNAAFQITQTEVKNSPSILYSIFNPENMNHVLQETLKRLYLETILCLRETL